MIKEQKRNYHIIVQNQCPAVPIVRIWLLSVEASPGVCLILGQKTLIYSTRHQPYRVDGGVGVDLQGVDIIPGVLEEPIVWIQHFMGQQVQPLPRK